MHSGNKYAKKFEAQAKFQTGQCGEALWPGTILYWNMQLIHQVFGNNRIMFVGLLLSTYLSK
jgi:hypothetical protein